MVLPQARRFELLDLWLTALLDVAVLTGHPGAHETEFIPKPSAPGPLPVRTGGPAVRATRNRLSAGQ
ncbi:hypothetical protein GCM10027456_68360 [Kineosporia babensis]